MLKILIIINCVIALICVVFYSFTHHFLWLFTGFQLPYKNFTYQLIDRRLSYYAVYLLFPNTLLLSLYLYFQKTQFKKAKLPLMLTLATLTFMYIIPMLFFGLINYVFSKFPMIGLLLYYLGSFILQCSIFISVTLVLSQPNKNGSRRII